MKKTKPKPTSRYSVSATRSTLTQAFRRRKRKLQRAARKKSR